MKIIRKVLGVYSFIFIVTITIASVKDRWVSFLFILPILFHFLLRFRRHRTTNGFRVLDTAVSLYGLLFALLFFWVTLFSARNLREIAFALSYVPLVMYFTLSIKFFFKRKIQISESRAIVLVRDERAKDEARRKFIKILAGVGLSTFLLYLINPKKAGGAFFGSIPGPGTIYIKDSGGAKIDPAIKSPTDSYGIANVDEAAYPHYYGFVHYNGTAWYILKETSDGVYTYASNVNNTSPTFIYANAWTNRAAAPTTGPTYTSFDSAF